jgi:RHS repeat-associated protein
VSELTNAFFNTLGYNANGNLTNNAGTNFIYDDENQLVEWNQGSPSVGAHRSVFGYDGLGRLRTRAEYLGNGSDWAGQSVTGYIYDGNRVIQERDGDNNPTVSYTRGTDLSGSLEGAGGIGGLLARSAGYACAATSLTICITNYTTIDWVLWIYNDGGTNVDAAQINAGTGDCFTFDAFAGVQYTIFGTDVRYHGLEVVETFNATLEHHQMDLGPELEDYTSSESGSALCGPTGNWTRHDYYFADDNGNITYLVDASQAMAAKYRYDPFGNTISQSGTLADNNVYRFSSKEFHVASGMYYYLYRFYDRDPLAGTQFLRRRRRGLAFRTPVEFLFGPNLSTSVYNNPTKYVDPDGRFGIAFGNNSGSSYINMGFGAPSLYVSPDSLSDVGHTIYNLANDPIGEPLGITTSVLGLLPGGELIPGDNYSLQVILPFKTGGAITLGHTICYEKNFYPWLLQRNGIPVGEHEYQHTYQDDLLGFLYLPLNIIGGINSMQQAPPGYPDPWHYNNFMEIGPGSNPPEPW